MNLGLDYIDSLVEEDENEGIYRCKREMFTDPRLFDLEMKHIFEGNWIYLAHESQIPEQSDGFCKLRYNWYTLNYRYKTVDHFFGTNFCTLDTCGESPLIKAKKVVLKNDYVRQFIDVYHV